MVDIFIIVDLTLITIANLIILLRFEMYTERSSEFTKELERIKKNDKDICK